MEDEDTDDDESVDGDDVIVGEAVPGTNSTVPGEDGYVEGHVDGGLKGVVFCVQAEPIAFGWSSQLELLEVVQRDLLPGGDVASDEARKDIIAA